MSGYWGLIDRVRDAGVPGTGAQFAYQLLGRKASLIIANGVDCEPLARADSVALERYPEEVAKGLCLAVQTSGARNVVVATRVGQESLAGGIVHAAAKFPALVGTLRPVSVPGVYPAGEDRQILLHVRRSGALPDNGPSDLNAAVFSIRTLIAMAAAERNQMFTHQLVAVMGAVKNPLTAWAPRGCSLATLVEAAGGPSIPGPTWLIPGGPLRGALAHSGAPIGFGASLLVVLPANHSAGTHLATPLDVVLRRALSACESCEQCTNLCPSNLGGLPVAPHRVMRAISYGLDHEIETFKGAAHCTGCGLCTHFACPVGLDPSAITWEVRTRLAHGGYRAPETFAEPSHEWGKRQVPLERLLGRLDLKRYDVAAPLGGSITTDYVRLPLESESGARVVPIVRDGHCVKAGQKIADLPDLSTGVPLHASISGKVRLGPDEIEIRG